MRNPLRQFLKGPSRHYEDRGYQVFRGAFPTGEINAIADLVRRLIPPYRGAIRRQSGRVEANEFHPGSMLVKNAPANGHLSFPAGLEPLSAALRALVSSPALAERLREIDGAEHYTIHQTILFMAPPETDLHIDSWTMDTAPHGYAHTVWIPLQDLDYTSGVPCVIPWPRGKFVSEADLGLAPREADMPFIDRYHRYHLALSKRLLESSPDVVTSFMRKGDFIVWSSLTPHCTMPPRPEPKERLSLQVIIRPTDHRWGTLVTQPPVWTQDRAERISDRFSFLLV
jgi:hypothetical protein